MAEIELASLFGKLTVLGYRELTNAWQYAFHRGDQSVELVHWLHQIYMGEDSDLHRVARHFSMDCARLMKDLTRALPEKKRASSGNPGFSPQVEEAVERGWVYATLLFKETRIRTGCLMVAILRTRNLRETLWNLSDQFKRIKCDELSDDYGKILSDSPEATMDSMEGGALLGDMSGVVSAAANGIDLFKEGKTANKEGVDGVVPVGPGSAQAPRRSALQKFTVDLTEKAKNGELDPVIGRETEIRQIMDILMRRRQNNPILTGEAGVGKTAVVEGFALKIAAGEVPPALRDVSLKMLDLGLLQAGASVKGEFENRVRQLIDEVKASPKPVILFIDEAHMLIGAGGAAGQGDAANLFKPALARGTLRTIAATTWAEYKKYFEKDPALTRRFQVVKVEEPDENKAIAMLHGLKEVMERHHNVQILNSAFEAAVKLSHRYLPSRQLPDKAISLLDTAAARVSISQHAIPPEVEQCRIEIKELVKQQEILQREYAFGVNHEKRLKENEIKLSVLRQQLEEKEAAWSKEREIVGQILEVRKTLLLKKTSSADHGQRVGSDDRQLAELRDKLTIQEALLKTVRREVPLVMDSVDEQSVACVLSDWTGIPVGRMVKNEIEAVLHLVDALETRIIGQRFALETIAKRIQTARAGLDNPNRPIGVFLLVGTSGVGKTETALALGEALYGGEHNVITINMSEFQEAHTVSTLKGAPPGYVGYGEGGVLTEAVRRRPYSIVLLDEVEKAHPDVYEIFFQVFDKGWMEDGEGRYIDFKNTIILLTTNVGSEQIHNLCKDPELCPDAEGLAKALRPILLKTFPAALLGRVVTVPYFPLSDSILKKIVRLQLDRIIKRTAENKNIAVEYDDKVVDLIACRCTEVESGGRMVDAILTNTLLPAISREFLIRLGAGRSLSKVKISADNTDFCYEYID